MTYVVTEACVRCKYTDCVDVCPTDCFHEGPEFLVIDPNACIDCSLCEPECPAHAIYRDIDLPATHSGYLEINQALALRWPLIQASKSPLAEAEAWLEVVGKGEFLRDALAEAGIGPAGGGP